VNQPTVLIVSDDEDFIPVLMRAWAARPVVPDFICVSSEAAASDSNSAYDVAIAGPLRPNRAAAILGRLEQSGRPFVYVPKTQATLRKAQQKHPQIVGLPQEGRWQDVVVILALEMLRRVHATSLAQRAEQDATSSECHAVLGRYMLDVRHKLNNALTSVLGNAELLMANPEGVSERIREQIETIHSMSLRIHEILHRFSSLEHEMKLERQPHAAVVHRM
jgi:signal transduction histidine kinase